MPLRRYQIRNEYGLADPELYRAADKDDPEALLEGVAMAGLVGVLRQLGDIAEFAAEIFHDLHEEVMTTAARGHGLMTHVQQLETDFRTIEKALLSQTNHSSFFSNAGIVDWHPNLRSEQNLITGGDLPRFVMDSYEECRGPPRLFLLDKFDVAGAGACLKRYTDPSVFKTESSSSERAMSKIYREKRTLKTKKKGMRRNVETPEVAPTHAKLHQLFLEEHFENNYNDAARLVKLKRRQLNVSGVNWKSGRSYMDKFLHIPSPDNKIICVTSSSPMPLNMLDNTHEDAIRILEVSTVSPAKGSLENGMSSSPREREAMLKPSLNLDGMVVGDLDVLQTMPNDMPSQTYYSLEDVAVENKLAADRLNKWEDSPNEHRFDDLPSEVDNYMDALTAMESETETDNEHKPRNRYLNVGKQRTDSEGNDEPQTQFYDSQSMGNSSLSDENGSYTRNRSNFCYSDTLSGVVDSAPLDGDVAAKLLSSYWSCEAEVMDTQSTQLHVAVQLQKLECHNSAVPSYAHKGEKFPELGEVSSDFCVTNSFPELLQSDVGANTASAHLRLSEDEEACNRHNETAALVPDDPPLVKNDLSIDSSGILRVDKLDHGCHHQDAISDSVFKSCDVSESIPDDEDNDSSLNQESHTDVMGESFEILAHGKIASPEMHLNSISIAPVDTYSDVPPEDLDSVSNVVKPNGQVSENDDGFIARKYTSENSSLMVDMFQDSNLDSLSLLDALLAGKLEIEQQSALTCTTVQVEPDSKGIAVQCDDQQPYGEGYHRIMNDEVRGTSTCNVDSVVDDPVYEYQLHASDHPDQGTHQSLTDELCNTVDGEDVASGVPAADCTKDDANEVMDPVSVVILSHSQNLTDMQGSPVKLEDSDLEVLHSTEATSVEFCEELETRKQLRQPKPSSEILCPTNNHNTNLQESGPEHRDPCSGVKQNEPVPIELEGQKDMNHRESYSCLSSSAVSDFAVLQESESSIAFPQERENAAYSIESLSESEAHEDTDELQIVTPDLEFTQDIQRTCGNSDSDIYDTLDRSSVAELTYMSPGIHDFRTGKNISILEKDAATIHLPENHVAQGGEVPQASSEHPEPGTFLEQPLESNDDLFSTELMKDFEKENLGTERIYPSITLNHEEQSTGASISSPEIPDESPVSKSLSNSIELDLPKQFVYSVEPIIPSLVSLPTHINLDEMPPMPPLPPMQWLGKGQPSSLGSKRDADGGSHVAFMPSLASRTDEKTQIGLHTCHQGILLPENLFFSVMDVKDNDPQPATGFFTGDLRQPVQIKQLPSTSSNFTGHFNYFPMEGSQAQNQFPMSCSRCTEDSTMYPSLGEEIFQQLNSSSQALPTENVGNIENSTSSQESVPLSSPSVSETSSKVHQSSPQNLEGMTKHSGIISTVPPVAETVQIQNRVLPLDVEVLDPSLTISLSEDGKTNYQGSTKLPRPRNPLIDAVVAHDKSKLRKVAECVRPQLAPMLDERDSLLEQIRTKSFNLKPAVTTRPSIHGPRTNLNVAAILEKANAIRQALAGSDEDDDADNWSDS